VSNGVMCAKQIIISGPEKVFLNQK